MNENIRYHNSFKCLNNIIRIFIYFFTHMYGGLELLLDIFSLMLDIVWSRTLFRGWVPVNLTGKVSDDCIRDLRFNLYLHQKLIGVLV